MYKINIGVITLFPNIFNSFLKYGLLNKAIKNKIINIKFFDLKKYVKKRTDHKEYGGGNGLIIMCEPIYKAILEAKNKINNSIIIYLTPQGKRINQEYVKKLSLKKSIIFLCGRYKGIDERIIKLFINEEISIGDFILNGGEVAAMVIIESISRLIPGVINKKICIESDSFSNGLLDYSYYTKPKEFMNFKVPDILLSGNHFEILKWRIKNSLGNTLLKRPDLIKKKNLNKEEIKLLNEFKKEIKFNKK